MVAGCNQIFGLETTQLVDGGPTIEFVQPAADEEKVTALAVPFGQPVVAGHAIVAGVYVQTTSVPAVSDSLGNAFVKIAGPFPFEPYAMYDGNLYIYVAFSITGGTDTVTVSTPDSTDTLLMAQEISALVATEQTTGATGSGHYIDGMDSGPMTVTTSDDLVYGFGIAFSASPGTGFTSLSSFAANVAEGLVVAAPGTYDAKATCLDQNDSRWTLLGAAFRTR